MEPHQITTSAEENNSKIRRLTSFVVVKCVMKWISEIFCCGRNKIIENLLLVAFKTGAKRWRTFFFRQKLFDEAPYMGVAAQQKYDCCNIMTKPQS